MRAQRPTDRGIGGAARAFAFAGVIGAVVGAGLSVSGCTATTLVGGSAYPVAMDQARVLDVQVSRRGTFLYMTNTTARSFDAGRLWVNRRWGIEVPAFGVGDTLKLDLRAFVDDEGDTFRAGGVWATRDPDTVVLVQLETDRRLYGFVVVENRF